MPVVSGQSSANRAASVERSTGGANLGGEDFEHLEREERIRVHKSEEITAADEAHGCASASGGGERIRLVADERGKTEKGAGKGLDGEDRPVVVGVHCQRGHAFENEVDAGGRLILAEKDFAGFTGDNGRSRLKNAQKVRVGHKCRGVRLHESPFLQGRGVHKRLR